MLCRRSPETTCNQQEGTLPVSSPGPLLVQVGVKLRRRSVCQGHADSKWGGRHVSPGTLTPRAHPLSYHSGVLVTLISVDFMSSSARFYFQSYYN